MRHSTGSLLRRVLVVTYTFPPVGGAGVQRITKFVKYLPKHGWLPTVLTVENPSVPVLDQSLVGEIPASVQVVRARSWEPSYALKSSVGGAAQPSSSSRSPFAVAKSLLRNTVRSTAGLVLQPDTQVLWYPGAVAAGKRQLKSTPYNAVLVTAPPFSAFLVGRALARFAKLPLLLDYRDEWTISNDYLENKTLGAFSRAVQTRMENGVLRSAHSVIATTQASANSIRERCRQAKASANVACIYNGYDADDFQDLVPIERDRSRLRIVYTGTLWNLTSIAPLVDAIRRLEAANAAIPEQLEVVLVGRKVGAQVECIKALQATRCEVVEHDYLDHQRALEILSSADVACLLLSDLPGAERVVPAKLFEYVASRRHILAITPQGEAWNLLDSVPQATRLLPSDVAGIAQWIKSAIENRPAIARSLDSDGPAGFDRDSQALQLAEALENMLPSRHS
jgi:glycosyltransferase involved in cell wall biosynthesis